MATQEGNIEIPLDGGGNSTASEYAVNPPQMLISRNVHFGTPGVPRRVPTGESDCGNMISSTDLGTLDKGAFKCYGGVALGEEPSAVGKDGMVRVIRDDAAGGRWANISNSGSETPGAVRPHDLAMRQLTTSGHRNMQAVAYCKSGDVSAMTYITNPSGSGTRSLMFRAWGANGSLVGPDLVIADTGALGLGVDGVEIFAYNTSGRIRVVWASSNTQLSTKLITISDTTISVGTKYDVATAMASGSPFAATAQKDSSNDWYVVYEASGGSTWTIYQYDNTGTELNSHDTLTTVNSHGQWPDIDHIISGGADMVAAALPEHSARAVDVVTTDDALGSVTKTADIITLDGAGHVCGWNGHVFVGADAFGQGGGIQAIVMDSSHTVLGDTGALHGYQCAARPAELDENPVWSVQWTASSAAGLPLGNVIVAPQWDGESSPGNLYLVPCGRYGMDTDAAATYGNSFVTKMRADDDTDEPSVSWSYTADNSGWEQTARGVTLNASSSAPPLRYAQHGGAAYVSGAALTLYDGRIHRESDFLEAPVVTSVVTGGTGSLLPTNGTYSVRAVFAYLDATGRMHRSAPSVAYVSGALTTGDAPLVTVRYPQATSKVSNEWPTPPVNDPTAFFVELYMMDIAGGDTTHKLMLHSSGTALQPQSITAGVATFSVLAYYAAGAVIYDEVGLELTADASPPVLDLEVIGDRLWLLDAEDRERLWPSKTLAEGYAFEFSAALPQRVPGGDGVALTQINGSPVTMRRDGLFVIYGDGPNNAGSGGIFSVPRRLDGCPGCITGNTVVKVPQGVIYQSDRGFFLLDSATQKATQVGVEMEGVISNNFVAATYSERDGRVIFWRDTSGSDENLILDVRSGKWSTWDPSEATLSAVQLESGDVATFATSGTDIVEAHYGTSYTAGVGMVLETAWLKPAKVNGRVHWDDVTLTAEKLDDHSITITVYHDYDNSTATDTNTWTAAELDSELQGTVYTITHQLAQSDARAIKVQITESAISSSDEAIRPISLHARYRTDGKAHRAQAATTGRK